MPLEVQHDWLSKVVEDPIDTDRRIVDPHHHFFVAGGEFPFYDLDSLWADTDTHNVKKTVYLQCWEGYRNDGPEEIQCVGETEYVHEVAQTAKDSPERAQIAGIIASCEMRLGEGVRAIMDAHSEASNLFRGIRQCAAWDADDNVMSMPGIEDANLYDDNNFVAAAGVLSDMGLVLDTYHYHHQLPSLARLARTYPELNIVLDHLGTPIGVASYAGKQAEVLAQWKQNIAEVAACSNVYMKLGGLAMPWCGFGFESDPTPPSSDDIVAKQADYYHYAIEQFTPSRCMFESNFPVDKLALSYGVLWNAFKKMAARYSAQEQDAMFYGTASQVYRLD
ncbi:MAG: amidohydrolase family protein [Pseudomonadota bacterium]